MTRVPFYCIRHKATGAFMPQMRRGRGYTHWNPATGNAIPAQGQAVPRLLVSEKQARRVIVQWACLPNAKSIMDYDGDMSVDVRSDGRSKDNLEVVPVLLMVMG